MKVEVELIFMFQIDFERADVLHKLGEVLVEEVMDESWRCRCAYFKKPGSGCRGEVESGVG